MLKIWKIFFYYEDKNVYDGSELSFLRECYDKENILYFLIKVNFVW